MRISDELAKEVKALRSDTDMTLEQIANKAKLNVRQVRFILYERDNIRVIELKLKWQNDFRQAVAKERLSTSALTLSTSKL
jgi:hypothetical protein